jgi:hypothetical protein
MMLAVLAMTIQALVPPGFMLARASDTGLVEITLCSSQGAVTAFLAPDGQIVKSDDSSHREMPQDDQGTSGCAFGALSQIAMAPLSHDTTPQMFAYERPGSANPPSVSQISVGLAAPPPPKTGPPRQA